MMTEKLCLTSNSKETTIQKFNEHIIFFLEKIFMSLELILVPSVQLNKTKINTDFINIILFYFYFESLKLNKTLQINFAFVSSCLDCVKGEMTGNISVYVQNQV